MSDAIISPGSEIGEGTVIENAIVGLRSIIGKNCDIRDAMLMGADYYESESKVRTAMATGGVPIGIGNNTVIRSAIVDKNARIGDNCKIINKEGVEESNREDQGYHIRSGIVVVTRNGLIPSNTVI